MIMKILAKTEKNIGQTRKNDHARRKTHEGQSDQRTNDDRKKGKMSKERKHTKSCFLGEKRKQKWKV